MSRFSSVKDVNDYLDSIPMFGKIGASAGNFSLDNIREFCSALGNPQNNFRSIHVAGTNGKGTVCYLLEAIYRKAGYKTGMFTSPHLLRFNERFRINGTDIPDGMMLEFFKEAEGLLSTVPLTYFEISTALAFWLFAKERVDIAIIETGLGGRLDSTNIINPIASVITSIGMDHEQILGNTLAEIASEKAGIIKRNTPVIIGDIKDEADKVINKKASEMNAVIRHAKEQDPVFDNGIISLKNDHTYKTRFIEPINKWNIAMCKMIVLELKKQFEVDETQFKNAIEEFPGIPARFEKIHPNYPWYFSGSHNLPAVQSLMEGVGRLSHDDRILVFSAMKDKLKPEIMDELKEFDIIYFVQQEGDRAAQFDEVRKYLKCKLLTEEGFRLNKNEFKTSLVIFAGSFYFYPIIKRWVTNLDN